MTLPATPRGWAGRLSTIHKTFCAAHGTPRFPVNASELALEYSKQYFPDESITKVEGEYFDQFEGALVPNDDKSEWLIVYSKSSEHCGRINFTVAHEFGHYLLHRQQLMAAKQCTRRDMTNTQPDDNLEAEANIFAASLLMPAEDFCKQIHNQTISRDLIEQLSNRYSVSLSALVLRLIDIISQPAMVVFGNNGFIDWAWSNKQLMEQGVFYSTRKTTVELPAKSLACLGSENTTSIIHAEGVWPGSGKVEEILIYGSDEFSLSLLLYESSSTKGYSYAFTEDEEEFL